MSTSVKIAFCSGTAELNLALIERLREIYPELPLWVVSDFPPQDASLRWIRYRVARSLGENLRICRDELRGCKIRLAGVMLVPNVPFRRMRLLAFLLSPRGFIAFNEHLNHFMLRPGAIGTIAGHLVWRLKNTLRWAVRWTRQAEWRRIAQYVAARAAALLRPPTRGLSAGETARNLPSALPLSHAPANTVPIAVVIPSRTGRELLAAQLPGLLAQSPAQVVVVDNGSTDGTAEWLAEKYPGIEVVHSEAPLSFARAVNRGIARGRHRRVCLLNNDMLLEPGFFAALDAAFGRVPELFCASAQIRFPAGVRREETGKTVMAQSGPEQFPVRCDEPLPGEDGTYVLYGSGGCSLYDAEKLRMLGGFDEAYEPAYVEDLDLGWRAWQRGWPTVYVAGAVVEHRHRATTTRYFSEGELSRVLETNYLRFVARAVSDPALFRRMWRQAIDRLWLLGGPLDAAPAIAQAGGPRSCVAYAERLFTALTDGSLSVFPGRAPTRRPRVLIASPYLPFPLSHGGAVRIYNLMRRAAREFDMILVASSEEAAPPAREVLEMCAETVLVRRTGSHETPFRGRPEAVEEFDSTTFRAALQQIVRKWQPAIVQLEFTQLAQYAADCAPARTVLVEHDITFDLYRQLLPLDPRWELRRETELWERFETAAWRQVDRVVTMSRKDRDAVRGAPAVLLANGVDLDRFQPSTEAPEARRILFIGSFAHRPNRIAVEFFVNEVWPRLSGTRLHIVAGARHDQFAVAADLRQTGIEVEGFVADVRPAYRRAEVVVAPLTASAGTNIKVLEAMAMGKTLVSTPAGVNGLDLTPGADFLLARTAAEMAAAIETLFGDAEARMGIERSARATVERQYSWDAIGKLQSAMYRALLP